MVSTILAESLRKKQRNITYYSNMPKDNHSVMQLYLDGFENNFYTFFMFMKKFIKKIKGILQEKYLIDKSLDDIMFFKKAENVFRKKKIPFKF